MTIDYDDYDKGDDGDDGVGAIGNGSAREDADRLARADGELTFGSGGDLADHLELHGLPGGVGVSHRVAIAKRLGEGRRVKVAGHIAGKDLSQALGRHVGRGRGQNSRELQRESQAVGDRCSSHALSSGDVDRL